jgi:hypothetical protein
MKDSLDQERVDTAILWPGWGGTSSIASQHLGNSSKIFLADSVGSMNFGLEEN